MILQPFTNRCDICGKPRTPHTKHDACAKKRKTMGFAAVQVPEAERIAKGKEVQRRYKNDSYFLLKEWR